MLELDEEEFELLVLLVLELADEPVSLWFELLAVILDESLLALLLWGELQAIEESAKLMQINDVIIILVALFTVHTPSRELRDEIVFPML